jgi:hypothetical protein
MKGPGALWSDRLAFDARAAAVLCVVLAALPLVVTGPISKRLASISAGPLYE